MKDITIGFIGTGKMGEALVRGIAKAGLVELSNICATDIDEKKLEELAADPGINTTTSLKTLVRAGDVIVLAVKPQSMDELLRQLAFHITPEHLVISVAAGISTGFVERRLPSETRVVRVMPNTPAMVRAGATALCRGSRATDEEMVFVRRLFAALGTVVIVDEKHMDAVTALSGSGPAYFFYLAEKLRQAAVEHGLPEKEADELVRQTLYGAGKLLCDSGAAPEELRARVTSKGGTTAAAVGAFEAADLSNIVARAVAAAVARSKELGL